MTSDEVDYGPGEIAVLNGSGFVPNELVTLRVIHADATPSTGADHDPWTVAADESGRFVTTWHVCEDDCVNKRLLATADGLSSGLRGRTSFTDSHQCGTGVVTSVVGVGGACTSFTPAVGGGPDNYEVVEGGTYTMTITGVTECSGSTITVLLQNSSAGNLCFNATGGSGTYVGTFTMPNPACNTSPISYKCGASAACNHPGSLAAQGPNSGCNGVHLRASNFNGSCVKTSTDTDCGGAPPTGACCLADGSCVQVTSTACASQGGTYHGDNSLCGSVTCPQPTGSCCLVDGSCVDGITEAACNTAGGTYNGNGTLCSGTTCSPGSGACCLTDGSCVQTTEADCTAQGGTYQGDFTLCGSVTCPQPTGSCCLVDGTCVDDVTAAECTALGGTYNGDGTLCSGVTCPPVAGACCLADGSCVQTSQADCTTRGGTYQGDLTLCQDADCPQPMGACCLDATTCVQLTEEECTEQGGIFHGDFSLCSNFDCLDDFPGCVTITLDFETDDTGNPMPHGAKVDTEFDGGPVFPVTITGLVHASGQNTAAILNSTTGPAAVDPDLLVNRGNILILQNDANLSQCPPASGIYCSHNDDEDGGMLSFTFNVPVTPKSIVLIDIDGDPTSFVILIDTNGLKRQYTVPADWTGDQIEDGPPGWKLLDLTTLANQIGFNSTVTAIEQAGFNASAVKKIDVILGGSGAVDNLIWCQ